MSEENELRKEIRRRLAEAAARPKDPNFVSVFDRLAAKGYDYDPCEDYDYCEDED